MRSASLATCVFLSFLFASTLLSQEVVQPNVIVVMTDDQGYGDFGFTGNPVIQTPNLDRLAKQSVRVDRFYVCPVCAPTRASLMTGRWHMRTRAIDTYIGRAMMDPEEVTVAEVLRGSGYRTGIFGKWHLGDCYPMRPQDQGFEKVLVHRGGGIGQPSDPTGGERKYTDAVLFQDGKQVATKGYCTDVYFDAAIQFIDSARNEKKPFFAYIPTNAPHGPFHDVPKKLYQDYLKQDLDAVLPGRLPEARRKRERDRLARIYAMISNVDGNVGRLLEHLDSRDLVRNTIVVFLCDNGPNGNRYTAGLRGMKGHVHEGGIRTPFLVRWPARLAPRTVPGPGAHIDLLPTLLDACGVKPPPGVALDGRSLLPDLLGQKQVPEDRLLVIQCHRGDVPERGGHAAVMRGRWKFVRPSGFGGGAGRKDTLWSLYDLVADPGELTDVAKRHPGEVTRLRKAYDAWFDDVTKTRDLSEPPRIVLGVEDPCVLTRQDWRHQEGRPWGAQSNGRWFVRTQSARSWKFLLRFRAAQGKGMCTVSFGSVTVAKAIPDGARVLELETPDVPAGPAEIQVNLTVGDRVSGPHQVEVR